MKILVTGAAGFIGSFVCERFLERGDEVVGLDNFDDFYDPAIKRDNLSRALAHESFKLVEGDFRDSDLLDSLFTSEEFGGVIHLGARAGVRPSLEQAPLYTDVNLTGTARLLDAARRQGVKKFLFASSSSVYGKRPLEPFREDDNVDTPASPYAATKKGGELLAHTYCHLFGMDISCLRFFTVYGPRQRPEMAIHAFTRAIERGEEITVFGDGSAKRDFTYIDDIVDGIEAAFDRLQGYRIYNLGNGRSVELREVIQAIEEELGRKARIRHLPDQPGDVPVTLADVSRARAELGYDPKVPIREGIRRFVEWFRTKRRERD